MRYGIADATPSKTKHANVACLNPSQVTKQCGYLARNPPTSSSPPLPSLPFPSHSLLHPWALVPLLSFVPSPALSSSCSLSPSLPPPLLSSVSFWMSAPKRQPSQCKRSDAIAAGSDDTENPEQELYSDTRAANAKIQKKCEIRENPGKYKFQKNQDKIKTESKSRCAKFVHDASANTANQDKIKMYKSRQNQDYILARFLKISHPKSQI